MPDSVDPVLLDLVFCLANFFGLFIVWHHNRRHFDGLHLWLASVACQATGLGLLAAQGERPAFPASSPPDLLMTCGVLLLVAGLYRFVGLPSPWKRLALVLLVQTAVPAFGPVAPQIPALDRMVRFLTMTYVNAWLAWLLLWRVRGELRKATRLTGYVVCAFLLLGVGGAALPVLLGPGHPAARTLGASLHLAVVVLNACMTLSLTLMVNQRLLTDILEQQELFEKAFHGAPYAIVLLDAADGTILNVNDGVMRLCGYEPGEMIGRTPLGLGLYQQPAERKTIRDALSGQDAIPGMELRYRTKQGEARTGRLHVDKVRVGGRSCFLASLGDMTEISEMKDRLEVLATRDVLTGLPNRALFHDRFEHALAVARRSGRLLAVLSMDLDRFKRINDEMGHQAGDAVLVETARRLTAAVRASDTVSRFGGDEFVLLLEDLEDAQDARAAAEAILEAMRAPFLVEGRELNVRASLGVSLYPQDGDSLKIILRRSDEALYLAKDSGRDTLRFTQAEA